MYTFHQFTKPVVSSEKSRICIGAFIPDGGYGRAVRAALTGPTIVGHFFDRKLLCVSAVRACCHVVADLLEFGIDFGEVARTATRGVIGRWPEGNLIEVDFEAVIE
jgi:hypothetical protein